MSEKDPYEAPKSKLEQPNSNNNQTSNSLAWKVFFWITANLSLLGVLGISYIENLTFFDYFDLILSLIATVGLYGFAYYKPIPFMGVGIVFWRYFFYVIAIESFILLTLLPIMGIPIYGEQWAFDKWFLVNIIYMISILYAIYQYAYKLPFIWFEK